MVRRAETGGRQRALQERGVRGSHEHAEIAPESVEPHAREEELVPVNRDFGCRELESLERREFVGSIGEGPFCEEITRAEATQAVVVDQQWGERTIGGEGVGPEADVPAQELAVSEVGAVTVAGRLMSDQNYK